MPPGCEYLRPKDCDSTISGKPIGTEGATGIYGDRPGNLSGRCTESGRSVSCSSVTLFFIPLILKGERKGSKGAASSGFSDFDQQSVGGKVPGERL